MSMKERQGKFLTGQIGKQNPLNCLCETHSSFPSMASNFFLSSRRLGRETQTTYALSLLNFAGLDVLENLKVPQKLKQNSIPRYKTFVFQFT